jgi:ribonuclease BN (tRNA processing enzyme)
MRLIKYTHACVRLEDAGRTLLLDPGVFSEIEAYDGVSHILITHEHADHVNAPELVRQLELNPQLEIYTSAPVAAAGDAPAGGPTRSATAHRERFPVAAVGGQHARSTRGCRLRQHRLYRRWRTTPATRSSCRRLVTMTLARRPPLAELGGADFVRRSRRGAPSRSMTPC